MWGVGEGTGTAVEADSAEEGLGTGGVLPGGGFCPAGAGALILHPVDGTQVLDMKTVWDSAGTVVVGSLLGRLQDVSLGSVRREGTLDAGGRFPGWPRGSLCRMCNLVDQGVDSARMTHAAQGFPARPGMAGALA